MLNYYFFLIIITNMDVIRIIIHFNLFFEYLILDLELIFEIIANSLTVFNL